MISLKLSVVVCWLAMVGLEAKPAPALPVGTYSYTSQMGSNSIAQQPAETTRTISRGRVVQGGPEDIISYLPATDTPEVQEAKEKFFDAFKQQTDLINEVREDGLWSAQPYADYYEEFEEAGLTENEYEEEEDEDEDEDEEEGSGGEEEEEEDDDEEVDDDDENDSDEDSSSSSSEEEDSDEDEDGKEDDEDADGDKDDEDSDEDEEDSSSSSSSEEDYSDDSSSSSSSSSSEENGDPALLSMQALQALQPQQVEDTPEVQAAKLKFFDAYKNQLELVSNDV